MEGLLSIKSEDFFTSLKNNDVESVKNFLKENKELLKERDSLGDTPLHIAAKTSLEMTKILLEAGIDVNVIGFRKETPLFRAKNLEIAKYLIENGADIRAKDCWGDTPFFCHINIRGHEDIVNYLIQCGYKCTIKIGFS